MTLQVPQDARMQNEANWRTRDRLHEGVDVEDVLTLWLGGPVPLQQFEIRMSLVWRCSRSWHQRGVQHLHQERPFACITVKVCST